MLQKPEEKRLMDHDGYTLIETLVAVMLLAISLVTIMHLFSGGLRAIRLSNDYERAVLLAREKVEEIRLAPELGESDLAGELPDGYRWDAVVRDLDAENSPSRRNAGTLTRFSITVTVHWPDGLKNKSFTLETMIAAPLARLEDE